MTDDPQPLSHEEIKKARREMRAAMKLLCVHPNSNDADEVQWSMMRIWRRGMTAAALAAAVRYDAGF